MTATAIDKEITNYLPLLNESQKEAVLTVMKTFAQESFSGEYDDEFTDELNSRFDDYETGKVNGFTLEETENRAREMYRANQK